VWKYTTCATTISFSNFPSHFFFFLRIWDESHGVQLTHDGVENSMQFIHVFEDLGIFVSV
jgi:hypothetical protein